MVGRGPVEETLETFGTVEFDPHKIEAVSFVTAGQVEQVLVTPGQGVAAHNPLIRLGPLPSSSLEVEQARINLEYAQHNLDRVLRLRVDNLATNEVVEVARKALASAEAVLAGFGVDGRRGPEVMTAPFPGVVVTVLVTSGAIVHSAENALLIGPSDGLAVRAGFEPEDAIHLRPGMPVVISPVFKGDPEASAHAVLARLQRVVDSRTQLAEALIRPDSIPDWMISGTKVTVEVGVLSNAEALRIPREALLTQNGTMGVFVVENGTAHRQIIHLGIEGAQWVEVRSGLTEGAEVVTTGRTSLADGMAVTVSSGEGAGP